LHLYCPDCGYPILVVGHWDGGDFTLSLRDGLLDKASPAITVCPYCGRHVAADGLDFVPSAASLRWAGAPSPRDGATSTSDTAPATPPPTQQ
jgi:DNA-directed RNA polymerase subunit RPC12/RpoP